MGKRVYLDHNATTPAKPPVVAAVVAALGETGNPSSVHWAGRAARRAVDEAREKVAGLVGAADVVFTASGTEANALAIAGLKPARVLASAVEHAAVLRAAPEVTTVIPVDGDGIVDVAALEAALAAEGRFPTVVAVMLANNETGVIEPVARVARVARAHGAFIHCDGVQAAGRIPIDMAALGVHSLALSAHKLGGPAGVGALALAEDLPLAPLIRGGGQERRRRAGTENVPAVVGFGVAADLARADVTADVTAMDGVDRERSLRDWLEGQVAAQVPTARVVGARVPRLPNTSCLVLPGVPAEVQVMALDLAGVAVSAGAACSSGKVGRSHVLAAMGLGAATAGAAIRVSLGWTTTAADVERFLAVWRSVAERAAAA